MSRTIIVIGLLFGLVAAAASEDPVDELEEAVVIRLLEQAEAFERPVADHLDARVEARTSAIAWGALEAQMRVVSLRLTEPWNVAAGASSTTAESGSMRCRVVNDALFQCTIVGEPSGAPDLVADAWRTAEPALPAAPADP